MGNGAAGSILVYAFVGVGQQEFIMRLGFNRSPLPLCPSLYPQKGSHITQGGLHRTIYPGWLPTALCTPHSVCNMLGTIANVNGFMHNHTQSILCQGLMQGWLGKLSTNWATSATPETNCPWEGWTFQLLHVLTILRITILVALSDITIAPQLVTFSVDYSHITSLNSVLCLLCSCYSHESKATNALMRSFPSFFSVIFLTKDPAF